MKRIYFVRHAKAFERERWHHPDHQRPLTEVGYRQAELVVADLRRRRVDRVVSSPAYRCMDTVRPLAELLRLPLQRHDALFEGSPALGALALMRRVRGRNVVLCTHGDVMQDVLERLDDEGVDLDAGIRLAKGAYWTFEIDDRGAIRGGTYTAAPRGSLE